MKKLLLISALLIALTSISFADYSRTFELTLERDTLACGYKLISSSASTLDDGNVIYSQIICIANVKYHRYWVCNRDTNNIYYTHCNKIK